MSTSGSPTHSPGLDLAALIRAGDSIAWTAGSAEPTHLLGLLNSQFDRIPRASALIGLGLTQSFDPKRLAGRLRIAALGGAGTNRHLAEAGLLEVLPAHYSALPGMVAEGRLRIDVALVHLAADGQLLALSPMLDHVADAVPLARVVVAEINDQAPFVFGDGPVEHAHIDHRVHVSRPLPGMPAAAANAAQSAIGRHVARLIADGATLQVGLGSLPDAVLASLADKRDLGLHTGTMGDRAADLIEAGIVTNRRKPIDTGVSVTAGLIGSPRLYQWAHRNPHLRLRSPRYTHAQAVLAQLPGLVGINSALEVDLTGQVNAEVADGRHVGLIGGQADFMRGCLASRNGRGIIALESTARGGTRSRIVASLSGGVVTTARADADTVVTEWGIAELRGRTLHERARALIAIARPDYRRALEADAERLV